MRQKVERWLLEDEGKRKWEGYLTSTEFQFCKMIKVLEMVVMVT